MKTRKSNEESRMESRAAGTQVLLIAYARRTRGFHPVIIIVDDTAEPLKWIHDTVNSCTFITRPVTDNQKNWLCRTQSTRCLQNLSERLRRCTVPKSSRDPGSSWVDPRTPRAHSIGIPYRSACRHSRLVLSDHIQNSEMLY